MRTKLVFLMTMVAAASLVFASVLLVAVSGAQQGAFIGAAGERADNALKIAIDSLESPEPDEVRVLEDDRIRAVQLELLMARQELASDIETFQDKLGQDSFYSTLMAILVVPFIGLLVSWFLSSRLEHVISRPITQLAQTALRVTEVKDYSPRLKRQSDDEIGVLVDGFNAMLAELEKRDVALQQAQRELEEKVLERTRDLRQEIGERRNAEKDLAQQINRISLLNQIAQAIANHQDLESILSVVLGELTDRLPADFGCVLLVADDKENLRVASCREREIETAYLVWKVEKWVVKVAQSGWDKSDAKAVFIAGNLDQDTSPIFRKPRELGMQSVAALPLRYEGGLLGVMMVARRDEEGFNDGEQHFLQALSEHVALAGHQARLYADLQAACDELRQTQQNVMQHERLRALGQMASGVAHDINNALSPVGGFAELVLSNEPNLSENARKHLNYIKTASDDIAHIVARLREFYRARAQQQPLERVDVNALLGEVMELTRPRWRDVAQRRGINIDARLDLCGETPTLLGIEPELREALTNLVFNAVDAMPKGGVLTLRSQVIARTTVHLPHSSPSHVLVEVIDTGTGMNEEAQKRCLEPFFSTKGQRGTGLGLAMVYGTLQRHEGTIEIESTEGHGTTIRLVFPLRRSEPVATEQSSQTEIKLRPLRVLFVDDEPLLRELIREILESDGHEVRTADSGAEALGFFRTAKSEGNAPDVVITDLGMPEMDGRELTSRLKEVSPNTPVIMMTGWGKMMRGEEELRAPVDALVSKPPRMPELQKALRDVCFPKRDA